MFSENQYGSDRLSRCLRTLVASLSCLAIRVVTRTVPLPFTLISPRSPMSSVRNNNAAFVLCVPSMKSSSPILGISTGKLDQTDPEHDDFELWSPSEEREELCLF